LYTTPDILIDKYGNQFLINLTIKEPDGTETTPDLTVIDREIGRVDGIVDGYLRGRYTLPLSEIPPELAGYAEDMTIARIYGCMPERSVPEDVARLAKEAVSWLKDIQKGLASLSLDALPPAGASGSAGSSGFFRTNKTAADRVFSDQALDSFTGR
jgi:phage gp36-like protein